MTSDEEATMVAELMPLFTDYGVTRMAIISPEDEPSDDPLGHRGLLLFALQDGTGRGEIFTDREPAAIREFVERYAAKVKAVGEIIGRKLVRP